MIKQSFLINERPLPTHSWHEDMPYLWSGGMLGLEIVFYNGVIYINFRPIYRNLIHLCSIRLSFTLFCELKSCKCKIRQMCYFYVLNVVFCK